MWEFTVNGGRVSYDSESLVRPELTDSRYRRYIQISRPHRPWLKTSIVCMLVSNRLTASCKKTDSKSMVNLNTVSSANSDFRNPMHNLLSIHYELSQLNEFRDQAMYQGRNNEDIKRTLRSYFKRLEETNEEFEYSFWKLAGSILDIIRCSNPSLVVKLAKIIEFEERLDEKSIAVQEAKSHYQSLANKFRSIRGSPRKIRSYFHRFDESVEQSIQEMFNQHVEKYGDDLTAMLENLDWIYDDLRLIKEELVPCMPSKWNIFDVYVGHIHKRVYETIKNIVASEPDAATIIKILEWIKTYRSTMHREMGFPESKLVPPLLDGKESVLIDDYLHIIIRKVEEWMDNLSN